jgi:hypothetical protein
MKPKLLILSYIMYFDVAILKINLKGAVLYKAFVLQGIEILNLTSKRTTKTDTNGLFVI